MNNMNTDAVIKAPHKFSGKLKLETALQKLGDRQVTLHLVDETGKLFAKREAKACDMLIVTHGGRAPDRLYTDLRKDVLLVQEFGGRATLLTDFNTCGSFIDYDRTEGW